MVIQHNLMALNAYRQLNGNNNALAGNLEKLSSGYRINRAGDDAAGLAISEKMRAQIKGLETAIKNAQDGISLIQTAEGALTEVHAMLNRMVELAGQSANGIYDDAVDRKALDDEFQQLKTEIDRISKATNFNGKNLLDGTLATGSKGISISSGAADRKVLDLDLQNVKVQSTNAVYQVIATAASNAIPGFEDIQDAYKFFGISSDDYMIVAAGSGTSGPPSGLTALAGGALSVAGISFDIVARNMGVDVKRDTILTKAAGNAWEARVGAEEYWDAAITVGTNASDLTLIGQTITINGNTYTFGGSLDKLLDGQTPVLAATTNGSKLEDGTYLINLVNGATVASIAENIAEAIASVEDAGASWDSTGEFDGTVRSGIASHGAANPNREAAWVNGNQVGFISAMFTRPGGVEDGGLKLQIGDTGDKYNIITVGIDDMSTKGLGIQDLNIRSYEAAVAAVGTIAQQGEPGTIKGAINVVSTQRGALGALQNRLEHTINNLGVTVENVTAAESRIRDTDMAKEMMEYTKNSILVQAAQAMLAQANMVPQGVLQLLR